MVGQLSHQVVKGLDDCLATVFTRLQAHFAVAAELVDAVEDVVLTPGKSWFFHQCFDLDPFSKFEVPQLVNDAVVDVETFFAFDEGGDKGLEGFGIF